MKKAIALVRVSTETQAGPDRVGPEAQRIECRRIAAANDLEIVEMVELEGVSGAAVLSDPRFRRLLARLAEPDVEGVIVREHSRLMRPEKLSDYMILEAFREAGKLIYTPEGPHDLRTFSGRLMSILAGEMDAQERRTIRERTQKAKELYRRQGRLVEGKQTLPRGVDYRNERREDGTIHPVWSYKWPEAGTVLSAYRRVLDGETNLTSIGREIGFLSGSNNLKKLLLNPIYMGVRRIDKRKVDGKRQERRPEDIIEVRVIEEPLISPEDFEEVKRRIGPHRYVRRSTNDHPHVYYGLARCSACGGNMTPQYPNRGRPIYRCLTNQKKGRTVCRVSSIAHRALRNLSTTLRHSSSLFSEQFLLSLTSRVG